MSPEWVPGTAWVPVPKHAGPRAQLSLLLRCYPADLPSHPLFPRVTAPAVGLGPPVGSAVG